MALGRKKNRRFKHGYNNKKNTSQQERKEK